MNCEFERNVVGNNGGGVLLEGGCPAGFFLNSWFKARLLHRVSLLLHVILAALVLRGAFVQSPTAPQRPAAEHVGSPWRACCAADATVCMRTVKVLIRPRPPVAPCFCARAEQLGRRPGQGRVRAQLLLHQGLL